MAAHVGCMNAPSISFLSITEDQLGFDPLPYYDPATGARMQHARYNPVNVYDPRDSFTRPTVLPLSAAMAAFRHIWDEQVHGGLEHAELVAQELATTTRREVWGQDATDAQIAHARRVAGKFARVLSEGALVSL